MECDQTEPSQPSAHPYQYAHSIARSKKRRQTCAEPQSFLRLKSVLDKVKQRDSPQVGSADGADMGSYRK